MKIRPEEANVLHAEEHTDTHMTTLTLTFRNFANAPINRK